MIVDIENILNISFTFRCDHLFSDNSRVSFNTDSSKNEKEEQKYEFHFTHEDIEMVPFNLGLFSLAANDFIDNKLQVAVQAEKRKEVSIQYQVYAPDVTALLGIMTT
jgi:hypothetical protein